MSGGSSTLDQILRELAKTPDEPRPSTGRPSGGVEGGVFIGRFEVVRLLGRGGFGVVYQARDPELGRHVAVKVIRTERLEHDGDPRVLLNVFRAEAETAAKLNHPNIVTIHDFGTHEGLPYLVLELLVGETLSRRLERGRLPPAEATEILTQICRGMAHAHAARVIHRDLKPGNVFVREDGQVKVLDFGLARVEEALTGGGRPLVEGGTPGYMAPEQLRGEAQDERTDLYACGVLLSEMMAGQPSELVAIAEKLKAPDPKDRYQSARELLDALLESSQRELAVVETARPYRYLEHFLENDAAWFFGREREVGRLEQMLATRSFVAVVGPSGAGKSSLIHAGLVPRLRRQGPWTFVTMRPGSDPLRLLQQRLVETCGEEVISRHMVGEDSLSDAPGRAGSVLRLQARQSGTKVILVADQLEELVTQVHSAATRRAFAQALLSIADDPDGPTRVVVALRDDFLVRLSKNPELREALVKNLLLLGPPDAEGLAAALRGPAARLGHEFEGGLVDDMVAAVAEEAAPLPVLQLAASRLWERRDPERRLLTRAGLEAAGGVAGILAAHADEVMHGLEPLDLARRLLCELVTAEGTRRRWRKEELLARFPDPKLAGRLLERLIGGRLVTSYHGERGEHVELVHESLISGWTQLAEWLEADRADRQFRERVLAASAMWEERRRPTDLLWRGEALDEALRWRRRQPGLSASEAQFLERSDARRLRARRTRRAVAGVTAVAALGITVASLVAVRGYRAEEQRTRARELMHKVAGAEDPLVGALVLAELADGPEPPGGLAAAAAIAAQPIPLAIFRNEVPIVGGAISHDGNWAALCGGAEDRGEVTLWRTDGSRTLTLKGHAQYAALAAFTRDGSRLVTGSADGTVRVWRTDGTGTPIVLGTGGEIEDMALSPDETRILTVNHDESVVRLWRADGQGEPVVVAHTDKVLSVSWSADGSRVVSAGVDGLRLWRSDGTPAGFQPGTFYAARFSPDGAHILAAAGGSTHELRVLTADLTSHVVLRDAVMPGARLTPITAVFPSRLWSPDGASVAHCTRRGFAVSRVDGSGVALEIDATGDRTRLIQFSPDGAHLIIIDEGLRVVSANGGTEVLALRGHAGGGNTTWAEFSGDGSRVLTASNDGTARIWAVGDPPGARGFREARSVLGVAAAPDGRRLVTTSSEGTVRLWSLEGGEPTVLGDADEIPVNAAALSPDGQRVAIGKRSGLEVWSVAGARLGRPIEGQPVRSVVFSRDGRWLATGSGFNPPHVARVFRADSLAETAARESAYGIIFGVDFSPDASRLAVATFLGAYGWPIDLLGEPLAMRSVIPLTGLAFRPGGDLIATSSYDEKLRFWSTVDGHERVELARGGAWPMAWSPDGESIATGQRDGTLRVTRLDGAGDPVVWRAHDRPVTGVAFTRDGQLATAGGMAARLWLLDWRSLTKALREATTACLTAEDRAAWLSESPERARRGWEACERRHGRAVP